MPNVRWYDEERETSLGVPNTGYGNVDDLVEYISIYAPEYTWAAKRSLETEIAQLIYADTGIDIVRENA